MQGIRSVCTVITVTLGNTYGNHTGDPGAEVGGVCRGGTKVKIVPLDKLPLGLRGSVMINQPEKIK